jgi:hypothetical protein
VSDPMAPKKRMRHPLRNEWDAYRAQMILQAGAPGYRGVMARLMLDFIPTLCDALERERDLATAGGDMLSGLTGVLMNIAEQAIKINVAPASQRDALRIMLMRLDEEVRRRLAEPGKHGAILLPGFGG